MRGAGGAVLQDALARRLGTPVTALRPVGGGDINEAYRAVCEDGRAIFVKTNRAALPAMFPAEADGLAFLAAAGALRIPRVLACSKPPDGPPHFLALEFLAQGPRPADFDERLGRGLAALHRFGAPGFGLARGNFIGSLPQDNRAVAGGGRWCDFFRARRLLPQLRRAVDAGALPDRARRDLEALLPRLDELCGPDEPPARLHGDLWAGNHLCDEHGAPVLFDPAVYGGHREVDLAMMRLFGGYPARVFDAYGEAFPLAPGAPGRVALYQLYPLLVHVNLFGGGFAGQLQGAIDRLV